MIVTIDTMAKRYGKLPSEIMMSASTFDMVVMDAAMSYESYLEKQYKNNNSSQTPDGPEEDLMKIWENR